jgi:hypothetical protein
MINFPLLHVVVEQLLLLWSSKELDLAHDNYNCFTVDEDISASQRHWQLLAVSPSSQSKSIPTKPGSL